MEYVDSLTEVNTSLFKSPNILEKIAQEYFLNSQVRYIKIIIKFANYIISTDSEMLSVKIVNTNIAKPVKSFDFKS